MGACDTAVDAKPLLLPDFFPLVKRESMSVIVKHGMTQSRRGTGVPSVRDALTTVGREGFVSACGPVAAGSTGSKKT